MARWPYNTRAWQDLRAAKLAATPMCEPCTARGSLQLAKAVDHIAPINAGGEPFPPLSGLMSMCTRCHNEKTAANDRAHSKPFARKVKGIDADGNPFDPSDTWHVGGGSNHQKRAAVGPMGESSVYLVSDAQGSDNTNDFGFD